jgi:hypothetical protein
MLTKFQKRDVLGEESKDDSSLLPNVQALEWLSLQLLKSRMFPAMKSLPEIVTVIEYGRELGIPPIAALQTIVPIKGKLAMEAKAMLAVAIRKARVSWKLIELSEKQCVMEFSRPEFASSITVKFTLEEARRANLLGKDNWRQYPLDTLFARCASRGVRRIAPDSILGLYSMEEMRDASVMTPTPKEELPLGEIERIPEETSEKDELMSSAISGEEPLREEKGEGEEEKEREKALDEAFDEPRIKEPQTKEYKKTIITLSNGIQKEVTRFEALTFFKLVKTELGKFTGNDELYYTILGQHGYEKSNQISLEAVAKVWDDMIQAYIFQREEAKKKEKEQTIRESGGSN